jgi:hypothetical protein
VTKLTADPERPWAEWKHGKPLTQKQLATLLGDFQIVSETVHPVGLLHGKGYKRTRSEETWAAYLPGQNTSHGQSQPSEACKRANADEMGTSRDFQSVQETSLHGSKNEKLSNKHAGLHACTDRKPENSAARQSNQDSATTAVLNEVTVAKEGRTCAQCRGSADGKEQQFSIGGLWLHPECRRFYDYPEMPTFLRRSPTGQPRANGQ